jgi:hypothetical protein
MSYQGYLQDLAELGGDWNCLLPLTDKQTKLAANSLLEFEKAQCPNHPSESACAAMVLVDDSVVAGEADAENHSLFSTTPPAVSTNSSLLNIPPPLFNKQKHAEGSLSSTAPPLLHQSTPSIPQIADEIIHSHKMSPLSTRLSNSLPDLEEAQGEIPTGYLQQLYSSTVRRLALRVTPFQSILLCWWISTLGFSFKVDHTSLKT